MMFSGLFFCFLLLCIISNLSLLSKNVRLFAIKVQWGDLLAEIESNIHNYVFNSVYSPENMNRWVFVMSLLYLQILFHRVSYVAPPCFYTKSYKLDLYLRQGGYVFSAFCLSVCLGGGGTGRNPLTCGANPDKGVYPGILRGLQPC